MNSEACRDFCGIDADTYSALYERFLKRSPSELLDLVPMKAGDDVLDLCAGTTFRLTREALARGAGHVDVVDLACDIYAVSDQSGALHGTLIYSCGVTKFLDARYDIKRFRRYDVVACQQGINYWWNDTSKSAGMVSAMLKPGGTFVFNTFNTCPSRKPVVKEYELVNSEGKLERLVEVYYRSGDQVHHIQTREGYPPHATTFDWITPHKFRKDLKSHFKSVDKHTDSGTDIYVCRKGNDDA